MNLDRNKKQEKELLENATEDLKEVLASTVDHPLKAACDFCGSDTTTEMPVHAKSCPSMKVEEMVVKLERYLDNRPVPCGQCGSVAGVAILPEGPMCADCLGD